MNLIEQYQQMHEEGQFAGLAYAQFTIGEMKDGTAWEILNDD